jgi:hypothetical protein
MEGLALNVGLAVLATAIPCVAPVVVMRLLRWGAEK